LQLYDESMHLTRIQATKGESPMSERVCRWGILGAAFIAHKNWKAIRNASNCTLVAVASRDLQRAEQFVAQCQADAPFERPPQAVGNYEQLLASDEIDAVYVPLPTGARKQWVIRAAEAGKHVLCEKPVGKDAGDVQEILDACRRNNVQFMDGVMFMHSRRLDQIRQVLNDGESVGHVKRIMSQFSFRAPEEFLQDNIRVSSELEPLGCLGDLGWYNLRFALWVMEEQLPQAVSGRILSEHAGPGSPAAVPTDFSGELFYPDAVSAGFFCSFLTENQQWANVSGTKGYLHVDDFVLPWYGSEASFEVSKPVFTIQGCDFNMEEHARRLALAEYSNSAANSQETNLFRTFGDLALSSRPDPRWGEISLKTQQVLDACLRSAREGGRIVELGG
jgi:predicted dehydrogenase